MSELPMVGGSGAETILVVEDEDDVRSYVVETLRDLKYNVREAADGIAALALFSAAPLRIDLLLTDIVMPGLNGRELGRPAAPAPARLKVLFMTGYTRNAIVHQGRLEAGVALLQKPLNQAVLAAKIREILDRR